MKTIRICIVCIAVVSIFAMQKSVDAEIQKVRINKNIQKGKDIPRLAPAKEEKTNAFQVTDVQFTLVPVDGTSRVACGVVFNKNIDPASVQENLNIRLLKQGEDTFWRDASTQNNIVRVRPNFITWVSGASVEGAKYKMHLRGTLQSTDGVYLDCDGDGQGERGNLPPYDSQTYEPNVIILQEADDVDSSLREAIQGLR